MKAVYYFITILAVASVGLALWELRSFRRRRNDRLLKKFARGRLIRRLAGVLLLFIAGGMVLAGDIVGFSRSGKIQFLLYWGMCLLSVIGVLVIVVIDLKYTAKELIMQQQQIIDDAIELYKSQLSQEIKSNKENND
ncbi:hypothetical protein J7M23_10520 [Candidatus Sumerlaeota bacterium]|nr:hypothetical protein [Candidatus Sumerlaeota bacterium]